MDLKPISKLGQTAFGEGILTKYEWFISNEFDPQVALEKALKTSDMISIRKPSDMALRRQWRNFASNVEKLAA